MIDQVLERFKEVARERGNWVKILIGGAILWIPIVNAIAFGYLLEMVASVRRGEGPQLSEWKNPGKFFLNGLPFSVICLLMSLLVMAMSPIFGIGQLIMLGYYAIGPIIFLTVGIRMLDTGDWKEAVNIGLIVETVQKNFKKLLPLIGAHLIALLLCSALALLLAMVTFCLLGLGGLFGFSIAYFFTLVALLPLFTESMFLDVLESASPEPAAAESAQAPETSEAADTDTDGPDDAEATIRMDPVQETPSSDETGSDVDPEKTNPDQTT